MISTIVRILVLMILYREISIITTIAILIDISNKYDNNIKNTKNNLRKETIINHANINNNKNDNDNKNKKIMMTITLKIITMSTTM